MSETNTVKLSTTQLGSYEISSSRPETIHMGIKKDGSWCLVGGFRFEKHVPGDPQSSICSIRYKEIPFMPAGSFEEIEPTITSSSQPTSES